ncbi:prolyl oligopeptidase family serine peptidase [Paenibacillus sp. SYP-B3998]|uniref:Prolyl oligopeptidase family serine peptidase n=1 Tax=Paenibacillus sp. SYP-B3998 TaxID=2678564 RepID=A0A6G4A660_9BACL|nr:prolyl oligopeptidase family serine peptidase [Paenibacillus sp. SYP-B3998]NEW09311.1 prolyl oligopeptidase family serine peptidase [Paenibacillus sp. SYP-B3998]
MKKHFKLILVGTIGILAASIVLFIYQNTFKITEKKIEIETSNGILTGTLALPTDYSGKLGLVVFVHGDGAINDSYDGGYKPLWEKFASVGYASLSLNKPGINGSNGNWLEQSMDDRAQEAIHAIHWAKNLPMVDSKRIGLWGASQGGWVIPKIAKEDKDIAFNILVSPAINWVTQGKYNTRKNLQKEGTSEKEIQEVEKYDNQVLDLLKSQSSYDDYLKIANKNSLISKERWSFIKKNYLSDATEDLKYFNSPVHLVLGGQDINVDINNTDLIYRQHIQSNQLSVSILPDADHSMLKKEMVASKLRTNLTAIFFPRSLFDDKYLNDLTQFVSQFKAN